MKLNFSEAYGLHNIYGYIWTEPIAFGGAVSPVLLYFLVQLLFAFLVLPISSYQSDLDCIAESAYWMKHGINHGGDMDDTERQY